MEERKLKTKEVWVKPKYNKVDDLEMVADGWYLISQSLCWNVWVKK